MQAVPSDFIGTAHTHVCSHSSFVEAQGGTCRLWLEQFPDPMTAQLRGGTHILPAREVQNNPLHAEKFQLLTVPTQTLHVNCTLGAKSGEP